MIVLGIEISCDETPAAVVRAGLAAVLLLILLPFAQARVSMRIAGSAPVILEAAGGSSVHAADYSVNGIDAHVAVFAFKDASSDLAASLLRRLGVETNVAASAPMARLPARYGRAWIAVLPGMGGGAASAVLVEAAGDLAQGRPQWAFGDIPQPPGFSLEFSATSRATDLSVCVGRHDLQAGAAVQVAADLLARSGWAAATPAAGKVSAALFARGDDVALVCAIPRERGSALLIMKRSR